MGELRKRLIATGAVPLERMPDFHVPALTATIARMRDELARRGIIIDRRGRVLLENGVAGTVYHISRHPKIASEVFDVPNEVIPPGAMLPKAGGLRTRKASA
ncbi:hypothetical protein [Neoroseomonas lacus]|nr:hypothetical protein [Neoroseomonas lacus]